MRSDSEVVWPRPIREKIEEWPARDEETITVVEMLSERVARLGSSEGVVSVEGYLPTPFYAWCAFTSDDGKLLITDAGLYLCD